MKQVPITQVRKPICSLRLSNVQTVLLWADADPAARAMHVRQLCNHVPAARMLSLKHREDLLHLPCTSAVKAAVAEWVEENSTPAVTTTADNGSCMPADVTGQQACAQFQLLIAGGHDVAWQSLRSVTMQSCSTLHASPDDVLNQRSIEAFSGTSCKGGILRLVMASHIFS